MPDGFQSRSLGPAAWQPRGPSTLETVRRSSGARQQTRPFLQSSGPGSRLVRVMTPAGAIPKPPGDKKSRLDVDTLQNKVTAMSDHWAVEHLQVIRTLMERSALYRRALAPVMTFAGATGVIAAALGVFLRVESERAFIGYWFGVALVGLAGALLLVRRQALNSAEAFWSPPARRVATALLPCLVTGLLVGLWFLVICSATPAADPPPGMTEDRGMLIVLTAIWAMLYGCALHAAGFFTSRGLRWLAWVFIAGGAVLLFWITATHHQAHLEARWPTSHWLMGLFFGFLQLAYGVGLYFTEKRETPP